MTVGRKNQREGELQDDLKVSDGTEGGCSLAHLFLAGDLSTQQLLSLWEKITQPKETSDAYPHFFSVSPS